jgi:lipopolysaccharide export LptBFGC system permease protein LptF
MKRVTPILLIAILLILTVLVLSDRQEDAGKERERAKREKAFKERIAVLNREKENIAKVGNAYRDSLEQIRSHFANRETKQDVKVKAAKKRVDSLKVSLYKPECAAIIAAQDTVILELESTIVILKEEKGATWNSFNKIMDNDRAMIDTLQAEVDEYKEAYEVTSVDLAAERKQKKKARLQRNLAIVLGVGLVILFGAQ